MNRHQSTLVNKTLQPVALTHEKATTKHGTLETYVDVTPLTYQAMELCESMLLIEDGNYRYYYARHHSYTPWINFCYEIGQTTESPE